MKLPEGMQTTHTCGGTILSALSAPGHIYCDRCGAYTTLPDGDLPSGMDAIANRAAWDAGEDESPD